MEMNNYKVKEVISRNFKILKNDPEMSAIFTDNALISFRRNKNIRDNLVTKSTGTSGYLFRLALVP